MDLISKFNASLCSLSFRSSALILCCIHDLLSPDSTHVNCSPQTPVSHLLWAIPRFFGCGTIWFTHLCTKQRALLAIWDQLKSFSGVFFCLVSSDCSSVPQFPVSAKFETCWMPLFFKSTSLYMLNNTFAIAHSLHLSHSEGWFWSKVFEREESKTFSGNFCYHESKEVLQGLC